MKRIRFKVNIDKVDGDYRPIVFMTAYPYWCSGETDDDFIIVGYAENENQIMEQWPEAHELDVLEDNCEITFNSRFNKPSWYTAGINKIKTAK